MDRLTRRDLGALGEFLLDTGSHVDVEAYRDHVLPGLRRLVPCSYLALNEVDLDHHAIVARTEPREAVLPSGYVEDLGQLLLENPNIRHFAEHPRSPHVVKISDFMTTREFRRTRVYDEVYKRSGTIHQIGMSMTTARGAFVGIALNRDHLDFTERDRRILDILRPYLVRSYQNARAFSRVRGTLALLEQGFAALEIAVVVLTAHRRALFSSPMAERLMAGYFGARRANGLPDLLERWLASQDASGGDVLPQPLAPFVLERDDRRLTVRVLRQPGRRLLLLTEAVLGVPPGILTMHGLTSREAEILRWVTEGKTNPEVAIILGLSPRTVQHTLERVFRKLGVETRTAAATWALQTVSGRL
jgi:DNA-binding CsgD family transcriptional regulator